MQNLVAAVSAVLAFNRGKFEDPPYKLTTAATMRGNRGYKPFGPIAKLERKP